MPKTNWDDAEDLTINYSFKVIIAENIEYARFKSADRPKPTALFRINRSRQKYSLATCVLGDTKRGGPWGYCLPAPSSRPCVHCSLPSAPSSLLSPPLLLAPSCPPLLIRYVSRYTSQVEKIN